MKDKLELQKQYIEVKKKYDELSEKYWNIEESDEYKNWDSRREEMIEHTLKNSKLYREVAESHIDLNVIGWYKSELKLQLEKEIKDTFILLKSLNKQIYYER